MHLVKLIREFFQYFIENSRKNKSTVWTFRVSWWWLWKLLSSAMWCRNLSRFRRNVLHPFQGQRVSWASKPASMKQSILQSSIFSQNFSKLLPDYMTSYHRIQRSSSLPYIQVGIKNWDLCENGSEDIYYEAVLGRGENGLLKLHGCSRAVKILGK
jgi:hypothetical protein